jgi:hypothetical protein
MMKESRKRLLTMAAPMVKNFQAQRKGRDIRDNNVFTIILRNINRS